MGCGASVKAANADEMRGLCANMSKEMMKICTRRAMEQYAEIKVKAPPDVQKMRDAVEDLRKWATEVKDPETGDEEKKEGGGGMFEKISGMAEKAIDKVNRGLESVIGAALNTAADQLEKAVNKIEEPFTTIGKDVIEAKKEQIWRVFELYIGNMKILDDPVLLCRGSAPYGEKEYAAAKKDAITGYLIDKADSSLTRQLLDEIQEEIQNHKGMKAWQDGIDKYNAGVEKVASMSCDLKLAPIELNLAEYICEQIIKELGVRMGAKEAEVRANSTGQAYGEQWRQEIFEVVFSEKMITQNHYKKFVEKTQGQ